MEDRLSGGIGFRRSDLKRKITIEKTMLLVSYNYNSGVMSGGFVYRRTAVSEITGVPYARQCPM